MITFKQFISEGINDKGILKAIFIVGIPGAGKSYTLKKLSGSVSPRIVNTDRGVEHLMKKSGRDVNNNWPEFKDSAHQITLSALKNYLNGMLPLFIDGTSNDTSNILARAGLLESLGYDVGMIFINTPLETALNRAEKRERKVDPEFIKVVNSEAESNKAFFKGKFQFFKELNNNDGELTDAILLKAFKEVSSFFEKEVSNPVGQRMLKTLKEKNLKYLSPDIISMAALDKKVQGWYRS